MTPAGGGQRKRLSPDGHRNAPGQPLPKQQTRGEVQVVHRRNKGPVKIGRDLEPKARTDDGKKCKEDPTREETAGAQWADTPTGLAQVPPTGAAASIPGPAPTAVKCITESPRTTINTAMGRRDTTLVASVSRTAATTAAVGSNVAASVAATGGGAATAVTSGTEATAAAVKAMAEAGVAARAATANGMVEAAAVGAEKQKEARKAREAAPKAAGGTAENGPGTTVAKAESVTDVAQSDWRAVAEAVVEGLDGRLATG